MTYKKVTNELVPLVIIGSTYSRSTIEITCNQMIALPEKKFSRIVKSMGLIARKTPYIPDHYAESSGIYF